MLKSYLSIALRYMLRHKGFSIINLAGLTLGIACSLLIALYVYDELRYDTFHHDADQLYRVGFEGTLEGKKIASAYTGFPLGPAIQQRYTGAAATVRLASWATFPMRYENKTFTEPNLLLADSNFFRFFDFKLIIGHPDSVLDKKGRIVITESAARRYFNYRGTGDRTPLGKTMVLAQGYTATISGIAEDPPSNSHFHFTFILSLSSWDDEPHVSWVQRKVATYVRLKDDADLLGLKQLLSSIVKEHVTPELEQSDQTKNTDVERQGSKLGYFIQPVTSIHLHSALSDELEPNSDVQYVYLFISIAIFITMLACINFMNLSTARSASRAKEVGVRKTVGAQTMRLIGQFLLESYLYSAVAILFALFVVMVAIGPFNIITHKHLDADLILTPAFGLTLLFFMAIVGTLAGSYPAFYLTTFTPVEVMRGRIRAKMRSYGIRNVLVIFQFFISAGMIIATFVVYSQLRYVQRVSLGFDKQNIINLLHTKNLGSHAQAFKTDLLKHFGVVSASYCNRLPPNIDWQNVFSTKNPSKDYMLAVYEVDYDHLKTMQYKMVVGRFFSEDFPTDSSAVILNERAVEKMKLRHFGEKNLYSTYGTTTVTPREVIGIVQDFNFQPLKDSIQPMAMVLGHQPNWEMAIRVRDGEAPEVLPYIRRLWKKYAPDAAFEYTYVDKNFDAENMGEKRVGFLFVLFTTLAMIIACLGLFGLATFTAEQRTKEIGIRKVLGASIPNIMYLLNKDFLRLVIVANVLAWPVTWWLMNKWLSQFAYHTNTQWWMFLATAGLTILIAFLSVSVQAVKAGRGNPVNSLRNE